MRRISFCWLFPCLIAPFLLAQSKPVAPISQSAQGASEPKAQARILDSYGKLPLSFEANHGQTDARVKFFSRAGGYSLFLTADEAVIALRGKSKPAAPKGASRVKTIPVSLKRYPDTNPLVATNRSVASASDRMTGGVLRMKLRGANPAAEITGVDELAGTSNYFIGNDPAKWRTGVPTYAKVKYAGIYSGIDLVYYGNQRQLEYDFIVAPGADPRRIAFEVRGAKRIFRDSHGELVFKVGDGEVRWHRPVVYQQKDGERQLVAARYSITNTDRVGFEVTKYDASRPLYIDPLIYSTFLGGSGEDQGRCITVDGAGNAYITGVTYSSDFPTTIGAFQTTYGGDGDAFVSKLNATGSALIYSTYLGGSGGSTGYGIAVDDAGNAYVTGSTTSADFPITPGAFQIVCNGGDGCLTYGDAFITKINPTGSAMVYSTYLGGSLGEYGSVVAVDSSGDAYVTGNTNSTDFPTANPLQPTFGGGGSDAFVAELNPSGAALVYSTYLGGSGSDAGTGVAVDRSGEAYVTGGTSSTDFPVTSGAFQTTCGNPGSCESAFVTKFNSTGSALVYSTYLGGGGGDDGNAIAVDSAGNAYVTGMTWSGFPTTPGALQTNFGGDTDAFVSKFNPTGTTLVYSTYLGGSVWDYGLGIAVDSSGDAYVAGATGSRNFPTASPLDKKLRGSWDAFVSKLNATGSMLVYSTYLGGNGIDEGSGIAIDNVGNCYVTGYTGSGINFPIKNPLQPAFGGGIWDAFAAKIDPLSATATTLISFPNPSSQGQVVTFTAAVTSGVGAPPDGETVSFTKGKTVLGTGTLSGGSASFTTSTLKVGTASVKALYGGDSNFAGSTSKAVKQVVEKAE